MRLTNRVICWLPLDESEQHDPTTAHASRLKGTEEERTGAMAQGKTLRDTKPASPNPRGPPEPRGREVVGAKR